MGGLIGITSYLKYYNKVGFGSPYIGDLNDLKEIGIHRLGDGATNGPEGNSLGAILLTINWDGSSFHQIYFSLKNIVLYYRVKQVSGFTNWYKFTGVVI